MADNLTHPQRRLLSDLRFRSKGIPGTAEIQTKRTCGILGIRGVWQWYLHDNLTRGMAQLPCHPTEQVSGT